jgi:hypothetical protein
MTVQAIRALARNYGSDIRDRFAMMGIVVVVEVIAFGSMAWKAPNDMARLGDLLVLFGLAFLVWRSLTRWPGRLPDAGASVGTLIEFHRAQLERQRTTYGGMILSVAPMFLGLVVILYGFHLARPHAGLRNFAPFFLLSGFWFIAAWFMQRRQARRIQSQIDEIDALRGG